MDTPTTAAQSVAEVVSAALREAGISQREAAARTGIPLATLSRRLTGHSPFLITELSLVAKVAGLTLLDVARLAEGGEAA